MQENDHEHVWVNIMASELGIRTEHFGDWVALIECDVCHITPLDALNSIRIYVPEDE